MVLHGIDGDAQFIGDLAVFLVLKPTHDKNPAALLGQRVDMETDTFLQFFLDQHPHGMLVIYKDRIKELTVLLIGDRGESHLRTVP